MPKALPPSFPSIELSHDSSPSAPPLLLPQASPRGPSRQAIQVRSGAQFIVFCGVCPVLACFLSSLAISLNQGSIEQELANHINSSLSIFAAFLCKLLGLVSLWAVPIAKKLDYVRVAGPGVYVGCAYRKGLSGQYSKDDCLFFMLVRQA
eukprot:1154785-Pelagomonas_calceolata.AAC.3